MPCNEKSRWDSRCGTWNAVDTFPHSDRYLQLRAIRFDDPVFTTTVDAVNHIIDTFLDGKDLEWILQLQDPYTLEQFIKMGMSFSSLNPEEQSFLVEGLNARINARRNENLKTLRNEWIDAFFTEEKVLSLQEQARKGTLDERVVQDDLRGFLRWQMTIFIKNHPTIRPNGTDSLNEVLALDTSFEYSHIVKAKILRPVRQAYKEMLIHAPYAQQLLSIQRDDYTSVREKCIQILEANWVEINDLLMGVVMWDDGEGNNWTWEMWRLETPDSK